MKAGYKTIRLYMAKSDNCIVIKNYNLANNYYEIPTMTTLVEKDNYITGVWIPKNPDGTSKERPHNWPNKNTLK